MFQLPGQLPGLLASRKCLFQLLGSEFRGTVNPKYASHCETFVMSNADRFKKWMPYTQALSQRPYISGFSLLM